MTPYDVEKALKTLAKDNLLHVNRLRVIVALERLVCRLEAHPVLETHLIFKGGFALLKTIESARFTRDVDALARHIAKEKVPEYVAQALKLDLQDSFWFDDLQVKEQMFAQNYGGYRFDCAFRIGESPHFEGDMQKLPRVHLDVGFGDQIPEDLHRQEMHRLFHIGEPVSWFVYPLENILAEKLETLCRRAQANSRSKDVFDLIELFPLCQNRQKLKEAIVMTFRTRNTPVPKSLFQFASTLELGILEAGWKSIIVPGKKPTFSQAWGTLLQHFQELDSLLQ